jgi:hypothetical protein
MSGDDTKESACDGLFRRIFENAGRPYILRKRSVIREPEALNVGEEGKMRKKSERSGGKRETPRECVKRKKRGRRRSAGSESIGLVGVIKRPKNTGEKEEASTPSEGRAETLESDVKEEECNDDGGKKQTREGKEEGECGIQPRRKFESQQALLGDDACSSSLYIFSKNSLLQQFRHQVERSMELK